MNHRTRGLLCCAAMSAVANVQAQLPAAAKDFDIPAQELKYSIGNLARQAGLELAVRSDDLAGKRAPSLRGHYSTEQALKILLAGSGLSAEIRDGAIFIHARAASEAITPFAAQLDPPDVIVTGSRIRGAPVASRVIVMSQADMLDAGRTSLADAIRDIPQNFSGGTNPGVGFGVPEDNGTNLGGGSSLNLRGLGSDATLTLLNGHRLAYNVFKQAIDISAIPFNAVERIEVVADGASALYGSDAVGGVANVILKRDYQGLEVSARGAASTDGGNRQQQYSAVAGTVWRSGGIIAAYDFSRNTPIYGRQRSYSGTRPFLTLYPFERHHSATISGHQDLSDTLTTSFDVLFNHRASHRSYATTALGDYYVTGNYALASSTSFAAAPSLRWRPKPGFELSLSGMIGEDRSRYGADNYRSSVITSSTRGCYCNHAQSIELDGQAPIMSLPGGRATVAFGAGYRNNDFHGYRTVGAAQDIKASQDSYYGFVEASLPIVSNANASHLVQALSVSGAVRYEDYPGIDQVATPKFGLIYEPTADFALKGSWGKSFKAPTLYQQYNGAGASIYPAAILGGKGLPGTAAAIILTGGNPALKPERATSWTATLDFHPRAMPGLTIEAGYFSVDYRDRIVAPVTYLTQALSTPIYADLVELNPSGARQAAGLAGASVFNYTGAAYNSANVVAIINDNNLNVATQSARGADLAAHYQMQTDSLGQITLSLSGTYLQSNQRLSPLQPTTPLAGTLFNPPHVHGRSGLVWQYGPITSSLYLNYIGHLRDVRSNPAARVAGMTTADLTLSYRAKASPGPLHGLSAQLGVANLSNAKPSLIATTQLYESPYDSTNFLPLGRVISFGISKKW